MAEMGLHLHGGLSAAATAAARHQALDSNFVGWTFDPATAVSATAQGSGTMQFARVKARRAATVTDLYCYVNTLASGLTLARMAMYDMTGALLGTSADQITPFGSTGTKACTLDTPAAVTAGTEYLIGVLQIGTTPALLGRGFSGFLNNAGYTAAPYRFNQLASQASVPASITPGSLSASSIAWWMGMA